MKFYFKLDENNLIKDVCDVKEEGYIEYHADSLPKTIANGYWKLVEEELVKPEMFDDMFTYRTDFTNEVFYVGCLEIDFKDIPSIIAKYDSNSSFQIQKIHFTYVNNKWYGSWRSDRDINLSLDSFIDHLRYLDSL